MSANTEAAAALILQLMACVAGPSDGFRIVSLADGDSDIQKVTQAAFEYAKETLNMSLSAVHLDFNDSSTQEDDLTELCCVLDEVESSGKPLDLLLDFTRKASNSEFVKAVASALSIPTVSYSSLGMESSKWWNFSGPNAKDYLVQIVPLDDTVCEVIREIAVITNMSNAAILYESHLDLLHLYQFLLVNVPCRHVIWPVSPSNRTEVHELLRQLVFLRFSNLFVVGSNRFLNFLLQEAREMNMLKRSNAWFLLSTERGSIVCPNCSSTSVVFIGPQSGFDCSRPAVQHLKTTHLLWKLSDCQVLIHLSVVIRSLLSLRRAIAAASSSSSSKQAHLPDVSCSNFNPQASGKRKVLDLKRNLDLTHSGQGVRGDSLPLVPILRGAQGVFYLDVAFDILRLETLEGGQLRERLLGRWKAASRSPRLALISEGLNRTSAPTTYTVVTVVQPPFVMRTVQEDGRVVYSGYCIDLLDAISESLGFEYVLYESPGNKHGEQDADRKWNGAIGELINRRADMAVAALTLLADRELVVDFTIPIYELVGMAILMKRNRVPDNLFKFLSVLEVEVWFCIAGAYVLISLLIWLFDVFSPYSYRNCRPDDEPERRIFTLKESLWFCMTSMTPQGGGEAPRQLSGRLLSATWWLFSFIIVASYTANLAAFLTVSRLDNPISSLDDLMGQYQIQYGPLNGSPHSRHFEKMAYIEERFYKVWLSMSLNDEISAAEKARLAVWDYPISSKYSRLWNQMRSIQLPITLEEALEKVAASESGKEGFAYIGNAALLRYIAMRNCTFMVVGEEFAKQPYAIALQQGSPLKNQINQVILVLLNQRKLEMLKEKWWINNPERNECDPVNQDEGITIHNIGGVFIIVLVGIFLSVVALIYEYHQHAETTSPYAWGETVTRQEWRNWTRFGNRAN